MQYILTEEEYNNLIECKQKYEDLHQSIGQKHINLLSEHLALKVKYQELVEKYDVTLEDKVQNILFEEFKKTLIPDLELHKAILDGVQIQRCLKHDSKLRPDTTSGKIPKPLMYETYDIANSEEQFLDYDNYDYRIAPVINEGYLKPISCSSFYSNQRGI